MAWSNPVSLRDDLKVRLMRLSFYKSDSDTGQRLRDYVTSHESSHADVHVA